MKKKIKEKRRIFDLHSRISRSKIEKNTVKVGIFISREWIKQIKQEKKIFRLDIKINSYKDRKKIFLSTEFSYRVINKQVK